MSARTRPPAASPKSIAGENMRVERPFTGRSNLFAETAGVLRADPDLVDRINAVDETITLATLPPFKAVVAGEMVATVKIIPFAVPGAVLERAIAAAEGARLGIAAFRPLRIGVISTLLPGLKPSVVDKTLRIMAERLAPMGATIVAEERVAHATRRARRGDRAHRAAKRHRRRLRGFRHHRPARCDPGGDHGGRRQDRTFRHAGRSRQSAAHRQARRRGGQDRSRRAGLCALAEGERFRLGAATADRRRAGRRRRHQAHGGGRSAHGNRVAAAAPARQPAEARREWR